MIKKFNKIFTVILLTGIPFISFPLVGLANVGLKTAQIWNQTISYELVTIQKNNVGYDGLSFITRRGKKPLNRAVINTINFKKEALAIWKDFEKNSKQPVPVIMTLSGLANSLKVIQGKSWSLNPMQKRDLLTSLAELKKQMQYASWYDLYQRTRAENANEKISQKTFVAEFAKIRKQTIEYHELSHLLDAINKIDLSGELSEVRAFITELTYGHNPTDSLWQMVVGVIDEISQEQNVDSSILKMLLVIQTAQKILPPQTDNAITWLCGLSQQHSRQIALVLYEENQIFF